MFKYIKYPAKIQIAPKKLIQKSQIKVDNIFLYLD